MFSLGFLTDGGVSMIGLISMEVVPTQISGSAHGLACAFAQGQLLLPGNVSQSKGKQLPRTTLFF